MQKIKRKVCTKIYIYRTRKRTVAGSGCWVHTSVRHTTLPSVKRGDGALAEDHDVLCQRSRLIGENVLDLPEVLREGRGARLGRGVCDGVVPGDGVGGGEGERREIESVSESEREDDDDILYKKCVDDTRTSVHPN